MSSVPCRRSRRVDADVGSMAVGNLHPWMSFVYSLGAGLHARMLLAQLAQTSIAVSQASGRLAKIALLADLLRQLASDEIEIAIGMLSGEPRQGRIGIGYATLGASRDLPASDTPRLSVVEIDAAFTELKAIKGAGSAGTRNERLRDLLRQATRAEQEFIVRLLTGELRQGALEAILVDAVARATDIGAATVRRAVMM